MAIITDYASLKTEVANYLHRSDLSDDDLSGFVQFGEARLNRKLRLLQQENTNPITLTIATDTAALPSGWLQTIDLLYQDDKRQLTPQSVKALNSQRTYDTTTGRPYLYAVTNERSLKFEINADQTYTLDMVFFKKWDIATDDTNWLLENAPDAYLYASLLEAKAFVKNDNDLSKWSQGLDVAIEDLNNLDNRARKNNSVRMDGALVRAGRFDINRGW